MQQTVTIKIFYVEGKKHAKHDKSINFLHA